MSDVFTAILTIAAIPATYVMTMALIGSGIANAGALKLCAVVFLAILIFTAMVH